MGADHPIAVKGVNNRQAPVVECRFGFLVAVLTDGHLGAKSQHDKYATQLSSDHDQNPWTDHRCNRAIRHDRM